MGKRKRMQKEASSDEEIIPSEAENNLKSSNVLENEPKKVYL